MNFKHDFVTPYYHKGNGRIERVNRTIREALKKSPGALKQKLKSVIDNYNNSTHRALKMSPNEAALPANKELVLQAAEKYAREFVAKSYRKYNVGDSVLVRNEVKVGKMDDNYKDVGVISKIMPHSSYLVNIDGQGNIRRHSTQLRPL